jgi:aryl-alcohol dehydrogenase-like predicted oxidoreductase
MSEANYGRIEALVTWAAERNHGLNELAEAWLLAHPEVCSVISGATKLEHVQSNAQAADWALTEEDLAEVNAILAGEVSEA